uniref:Uncharacterized protein n=1 Tax=Ananas comosus var. bracteatus TaxID=296719 RepID=A0A6V7QAV3_ANACO|nr:unnamed protein product [Ananas comosus var. bracteatus]
MEKLGTDLDECLSQLCSKDKELLQLKDELEGSYSLNVQQKLEHEEIHSVLMVVKSKFWESCLYLENLKLEMEQRGEMFGKRLALMAKQLEEKNAALIQAQNEKLREGQMAGLLQSRIEHLESVEDDYSKMRVTLDAYKEMLDNSSRNVDRLKEEASEREKVLREDLRKALEALEQANCALAERSSELEQVEFDLERQKLATERLEKLKTDMEIETTRDCDENQVMRRELEDVLLGKMEVEEALKEEKERSRRAIAENDKRTEELQQLIAVLKEDNSRLELEAISAKLEAENSLEEEKVRFHCIIAEKDKRIEELQQLSNVLKEDISRLELEATSVRLEAKKSTEEEKKRFLETGRDMEKRFMEIKCQLDSLEQKCVQRMHEILRTFEQEKTKWSKFIEEKENAIADVQVTVQSLEHDLKQSLEDAAALKLEEKQLEIERLFDTFEKIVTVHVIEGQDNLFKNILIEEMEKELETLKLKLKFEEEQLVTSKNMLQQAKAEIAKERLDSEKDKHRILNELKSMQSRKDSLEDQLGELKSKTKVFHNIIAHLVSERKELVGQVTEFSDSIALIVNADEKLISDWKRVMLKIRSKGDIMSSEKEGSTTVSFGRIRREDYKLKFVVSFQIVLVPFSVAEKIVHTTFLRARNHFVWPASLLNSKTSEAPFPVERVVVETPGRGGDEALERSGGGGDAAAPDAVVGGGGERVDPVRGGGSYCFGAYSAALKASQGYDQSTLNAVSFFKDVGANVGVLSGALASSAAARRRPWLVLLAGAAQCAAGYLPIWLAVAGATPRPPVAAMCLYMLVAAHAQTFFNTANVVTAVENFPDRRGTVIGIMKGFLGLSGAILVQIYRTVFGGNPSSFILMLAILPTSLTLLLMFFVEVYPESKEYNRKFLDAFSLIALLVAGYLMFIIIGERIFTLGSSARIVTLAILLLLLLSPLVIVVKAEKMESEKPEECEQLLAESTSMNKPPFNRELEPSNQDVARISSTENPNFLEAMCTFNFWLLFLAMACGMGSGLATVNNIGQIGGSLGYTSVETGTLVSLWSIWNFLGRFGAGYTSDHFLRSKSMGRPLFISLTLLTMSVGHLIISSGLPGSLYAGSVLVGLCYGSQWSLMPSITSEIFGLRHFGPSSTPWPSRARSDLTFSL